MVTVRIFRTLAIAIAATAGVAGCGADREHAAPRSSPAPADTRPTFVDRAAAGGIHFSYQNGEESDQFTMVETLGGGIALFDFDGDGRLDLFAAGGGRIDVGKLSGRAPACFRNEGHWRFDDVTRPAGLSVAVRYSHGVAVADYNHDGFPDVLVTGYGGLLLFQNQGDGTFVEAAEAAALTDALWSTSAAWGDLNGDGNLDLYVVHYVDWSWKKHPVCKTPDGKHREVCTPRFFNGLPDILYFGNGDGTFRDGSQSAGLRRDGKGLGVLLADVDLDGRPDIYVANDTVPNFLYLNQGGGRFVENGGLSGAATNEDAGADGSMGCDLGDFNLDGRPDLWVSNYAGEDFALYRGGERSFFTHVSRFAGIGALRRQFVGWGTVFFDFDRDGDEDLFVANGHVLRRPVTAARLQPPVLLENQDAKRLVNVASLAGEYFSSPHMGRGVAAGDIDNDGDLDLAVSHINEPVALLSNESKPQGGWVSLRLIGTNSSRDPVGAVLFLETSEGRQMRQVKGGGSYASTSDPRVFFGLGSSTIRKLEIRWPSGKTQVIEAIAPNRFHTIIEPH